MRFYLILLLFSLGVQSLSAQSVVNTETKRLEAEKDGWSGKGRATFSMTQNINSILSFGAGSQIQYKKEQQRLLFLNDFALGYFNQSNTNNRGFQHIRYNYELNDWLTPEVFVQGQYNPIWEMRMRILAGGGTRFRLLETDSVRLFLGTLVMYEYEEAGEVIQTSNDVRLSSYLSGHVDFRSFEFHSITYYQPRLDAWQDFRVATDNSIVVPIRRKTSVDADGNPRREKVLSLRSSISLTYDSRPPDGLRTTFYDLRSGLEFGF